MSDDDRRASLKRGTARRSSSWPTWAIPSSSTWNQAAALMRGGRAQRFGLVTTGSLSQAFNRRVVERHLADGDQVRSPGLSRSAAPEARP